MQAKQFETFIKLMKLTTSDQDGEALSALRKANSVLASANVDWERILRSKVQVQAGNGAQSSYTGRKFDNAAEINTMFEALFKHLPPSNQFRTGFVEDVHQWWEKNGFLTEKQYNAILKSYERI